MCDDCGSGADMTSDAPTDTGSTTEGVTESFCEESSDLPESSGDLTDCGTEELPEEELNEASGDPDDCYGASNDGFCDLSCEGDNSIADEGGCEVEARENVDYGEKVISEPTSTEYDPNVFDAEGNLRVMGNSEYLMLSQEQRNAFEDKYNSLTPEEQAEYDAGFARADLEDYKRQIENGESLADPTVERDLNDIIDGKYGRSDELEGDVAEFAARGTMTAVGTTLELDPLTKSQLTEQAAYMGRTFGPQIMTTMAETAYIQQGVHVPTPIVHVNEMGERFYDYGQTDIKAESFSDVNDLNELKVSYCNDLLERSEYPETIDKSFVELPWSKITSDENGIKRDEFSKSKCNLISEWENENGCKWPTYKEDVYSQSGKLIRRAGDRYDAHHIQPLTFGGQNTSANLTPLHAAEHYDKQGIHSPESPFGKLEKYYREK